MFHKRLLKEFPENKSIVIGIIASQWISLLANISLVYFTATLLLLMYKGEWDSKTAFPYIMFLIGVAVIRGSMYYIGDKLSAKASENVKKKLREKLYHTVIESELSYKENMSSAEVVQLSTEGVEQLEIYFGKFVPQFFYSLLAPVTLFVVAQRMSFKVALVLLLCVPLIPMSIVLVQKLAKKILKKYWGSYVGLGDSFLESLQGLTTLKIFQADERYAKKMDEEAENFRKITMKVLVMQLNSISVMDLSAYGSTAAGIILSIFELRNGNIDLRECIYLILTCAEFFLPLRLLGSFFHIAMNGNAAADKMFDLFDKESETKVVTTKVPFETGRIQFDQVSFSYGDKKVLEDISFTIPTNRFTAIVGKSGCGKSTIASLLMGDLTPNMGTVTIGDEKISRENKELFYKKVTRVKHNSYLFQGTVRENLIMGNESAGEEDMYQALARVDLLDTITEKSGLSMALTEKASNLSGGQKQRLALARAILHNSDIYIFDEATSNVDVASENKIMEVILELAKEKTVILISHRLANVEIADQILVMDNGTMVESGNHEELLHKNGSYAELYQTQKELEAYAREAMV
ncbi:MAG: ABC transporter ATP-binding protein/permease [Anaerocolumna sp.]